MHRNVEIAKNVDNRFDGIFIKQRVGDVVIDFAVGDVAALLPKLISLISLERRSSVDSSAAP